MYNALPKTRRSQAWGLNIYSTEDRIFKKGIFYGQFFLYGPNSK